MAKDNYFYALGRRKSATARVRLMTGKGVITINGKPANEYFSESKYLLTKLQQPFVALDNVNIRGNTIEQIITGTVNAHRLDDLISGQDQPAK